MTADQLLAQMSTEIFAMAAHALRTGMGVPGWVLEIVGRQESRQSQLQPGSTGPAKDPSLRELSRVHAELARIIAPARPELIVRLQADINTAGAKRVFGQLPIVRSFVLAAVISLVLFVVISMSPYLNDPKYGDFFASSGWPLFVNEMFFLSSAALGASFSGLFQVNIDLEHGTFRPLNQSSYWVQFILGLVAGLLMSTLLSMGSISAHQQGAANTPVHFRNALLALVGGFSSSVVQRVIQRLIDALETVVRGSAQHEMQLREQAGKLRYEEAMSKERVRVTMLIADIQRRLVAGESPESVGSLLDQINQETLSAEGQPLPLPKPTLHKAAPSAAAAQDKAAPTAD